MYVCVCNGVTERQIEAAVENGATQLRELRLLLGVASECGRCASCAHQCLQAALQAQAEPAATTHPIHWAGEALGALTGALNPAANACAAS